MTGWECRRYTDVKNLEWMLCCISSSQGEKMCGKESNMEQKKITAVLVAAGASTRMGAEKSKLLLELGGKTVIRRTLEVFQETECISEIVLVAREQDFSLMKKEAEGIGKLCAVVAGGKDRQESVWKGVSAACGEFIAIHDGARPLVTPEEICRVCADGERTGAATLCSKAKDTVKVADADGYVASTPDRDSLRMIATPQVFKRELYLDAYQKAQRAALSFTDDCQLVEYAGGKVYLTEGYYTNIKITTPEDLPAAEAILKNRKETAQEKGGEMVRIGHGYDVHRLVEGRKLILGGVDIPHEKGLLGHSDADVLLHAISDSLLGAAALGDIGKLFPDTDPAYEGADSLKLLKAVTDYLEEKRFRIVNIDATVIAQSPKLSPYIAAMRENIARACGMDPAMVSVKATTEEKLGFTGRREGISAHAVCLISQY